MVISKEILTDLKEVYEHAVKLVNEESKNDPPTSPYRSHYKARDMLLQMQKDLDTNLKSIEAEEQEDSEDYFIYQIIKAFVCRDLGRVYVFTMEQTSGVEMFQECLQLIKDRKMKPEAVIPYVGALNELGIAYGNSEDHEKACELLKESEQVYNDFKASGKTAMAITDIFGTREEVEQGKGTIELESLYTLCTFYLAQIYGHLGELAKSAIYCHMTLQRQLTLKTYEAIDFALNAATLSQYFIKQLLFQEARHHLAAATLIMAEYENSMLTDQMTDQQRIDTTETFKHRYADVARCWVKYGLALLTASKSYLYADDEEKLENDTARLTVRDHDVFRFTDLEVGVYEQRVAIDFCLTFDDAKLVYHFVISWLDIAKDYYKAETEATEYAKITIDYAELYELIAFFEEDPVNQAKMHKRRAKYYEELLQLLNPTYYLSICRESWYGAALAHCAILDVKLDLLKEEHNPAPQELQRINQACHVAIEHFQSLVKSFMDNDGGKLKSNLDVDDHHIILSAYFHLGRLFFKLITPNPVMQLENLKNSLKYYKLFTEGCDKHTDAAKSMKAEVGVCRDMVELLPIKIAKVSQRLN